MAGDDFADRLADLDPPWYVALTLDDDLDVDISTNLPENADVIRVLAEAIAHIAGNPDWQSNL